MDTHTWLFGVTARVFCLVEGVGTKQKAIIVFCFMIRQRFQVEYISLGCYKIDGRLVALKLMFEDLVEPRVWQRKGARVDWKGITGG